MNNELLTVFFWGVLSGAAPSLTVAYLACRSTKQLSEICDLCESARVTAQREAMQSETARAAMAKRLANCEERNELLLAALEEKSRG